MPSNQQTIAFFGATGGCSATILAAALRAGYRCTALVRTPEKLRNILTTSHSIPAATIASHLTIHTGNATDPTAISHALISPTNPSILVDYIVSGLGAAPKYGWKPPFLTIDQPDLCHTAMAALISAVDLLGQRGITAAQDGRKPLITVISTTGISDKHRDVPYLLYPLYHALLRTPHVDKRKMEAFVFQDGGVHFRDFVIVRPTLLWDYAPYGVDKVAAGWEWGVKKGEEAGPKMGYTIGRRDVGAVNCPEAHPIIYIGKYVYS